MEASQEAALSLCELGRGPIPISMSPSRGMVKNWTPLFENVLTMMDEIQEIISEFLNEGISDKQDRDSLLQEFHQKLTSKIYVLSCVTKMQRKVEEAYLWPLLMEHVSGSMSRNSLHLQKSNVLPLYKTLDSSLTQTQLNLRQLHSSKQSHSHQLVQDLVVLLRGNCHQLNDALLKISQDQNHALPLLVKLQDQQVNHFLHTQVLGDKPVKEITNAMYVSVCRSGSRDIKEMVKLIQNLANGSYMDTILEKGKWSSLFKFGQETSQMNIMRNSNPNNQHITSANATRSMIRVNQNHNRTLHSLKRKLIIDYSPKAAKKYKSALILSGSNGYNRGSRSRNNTLMRPPSKYYKFVGDSEFASLIMDR